MHKRVQLLISTMALVASASSNWAAPANTWHIPDNSGDLNGTHMRDPWIEISNNPASPTTITIYEGIYKGNGANQTGGGVFYKGQSQNMWTFVGFDTSAGAVVDKPPNQYWHASFSTAGIPANDPIQYYIYVTTDGSSGINSTFIYAPSGFGDHGGQTIEGTVFTNSPQQNTAASSPFSIRNRPGWVFHANNRVNSGNDVQFWAKLGYIGDINNTGTEWVTNGALYYTTDGSDPIPGASPGTANNAATHVVTFSYHHPDSANQNENSGSQSPAGTPMWWAATVPGLLTTPLGTTVRYKVGFWNTANNEQKFGEYNAGDLGNYQGRIFSFSNGTVGEPVLLVNGLNANYTTTHVFVDETRGDSIPFSISFAPGQPNVTAAEVFTNLDRRDKATVSYTDGNGIVTEEGLEPINGDLVVAGDDSHYYKTYPMTPIGAGTYTYLVNATKTGAYRLTARWKVQGDNNWRYYTNVGAGRRDHAIVVSPVDARNINLYEANVFNLEAGGTTFAQRGTLEDMFDASNAPHQGNANHWNLNYIKALGCNWLWFQPIHPITEEAQQGHDPGSPYSVRNFFDVNPYMTTLYDSAAGPNDPQNRTRALQAFQGFVGAANAAGVGVMLDAPFNHTAPDCEISSQGTALFGNNPGPFQFFRDVEARLYSRAGNYAMRGSNAGNIAIAPDRGDFGKWDDVRDIFFGRYAALVDINPDDDGNYLNEGDWFDYSIGNESSSGSGNGHFDGITQNIWRYFSNYTLYWLGQTGVPPGADVATQTSHGIGGLRADFGQGLPPQLWEYIINKTRARKWNFVFMTETLDGGAVTYRSNRQFDIENENIVFPLKNAAGASDYRAIFEARRGAYGQGLVLLNNMSHDEEAFQDPWNAVVRYAVCSTVDGVPLIFPGQELGISTGFGYERYETNFGKNIVDFKDFNSMQPAWNNSDFGNDQLYPVYAGIGLARLFSPALRSSNRFFLNEDGNSQTIFAVAKYETKNASPAASDVVFAFANTDRNASPSGNFHVNQDLDNSGVNDYGIKPGRTYNIRNIAAYIAQDPNRRNVFLWTDDDANPSNGIGHTGANILANGIFVSMNKVPDAPAGWSSAPYEAQYFKVYDVTPPPNGGQPGTAKPYVIGSTVTFTWAAANDPDGGISGYHVKIGTSPGGNNIFDGIVNGTSKTVTALFGQTLYATVIAINNAGVESTSGVTSAGTIALDPNGDEDGDGMKNSDEDVAGTNPLDSHSIFQIAAIARVDANTVSISWNTVNGRKYQLQSATTLGGMYANASPVLNGTGSPIQQLVTAMTSTYYRVVIVP